LEARYVDAAFINQNYQVSAAISLLGRLNKELFLDRLVINNEKWILYNNQCKHTC